MKTYLLAAITLTAITLTLRPGDARAGTPYVCAPFQQPAPAVTFDRRSLAIERLGRILDSRPGAGAVSRELYTWILRDPTAFTDAQRVAIQSRLFRLARGSSSVQRAAAAIAMRAFALSPERIARFETPWPIGLESVLGTSVPWVERATSRCGNGPLLHERRAGGGLAFRPIRAGDTHALVAQMVHVDTEGVPHITGLIDAVELRVGRDRDATACVLGVDAGSLSSPTPRLRTRSIAELPRTVFLRRGGDHELACVDCHPSDRAQGARDLVDAARRARIVGSRERRLIDLAARRWKDVQRAAL